MKFNWIMKPNKLYDRLEEPNRFFYSLSSMIIILFGFWLINLYYAGLMVWFLIGLYRVSYFIVGSYKRESKSDKLFNKAKEEVEDGDYY